jgi:hypothetical protein
VSIEAHNGLVSMSLPSVFLVSLVFLRLFLHNVSSQTGVFIHLPLFGDLLEHLICVYLLLFFLLLLLPLYLVPAGVAFEER